MPNRYIGSLEAGFYGRKSFDLGINRWASAFNESAAKLDKMDLPEEAVAVLRELFEDIGAFQRAAGER